MNRGRPSGGRKKWVKTLEQRLIDNANSNKRHKTGGFGRKCIRIKQDNLRMSKIDTLFNRLRGEGHKAFMPFITAGDPTLDFTEKLIRRFAVKGVAMCELGIPYSDPIADGPVIQAAYSRSLDAGLKLPQIFEMLGRTTPKIEMPIVTMCSYAIIYRRGPEAYITDAIKAGVAGAIVPDLPADEAGAFSELCRKHDFSLIQLIAPTTPHDRARRIAEQTTGFIYYVSVAGITGERTELPPEIVDNVAWLREQTDLPICIGFGISRPEHIRQLSPVADGLIVGSAIVRRMAEAATRDQEEVIGEIEAYLDELFAAMP
jgi:tryptophan synthase alpha chain